MAITIDEVKKVAALARVAITDEEAQAFTKELASILEYFHQLDSVDTTGFSPTYQVTGLHDITREDEVINYGVSQQGLLQNAPLQQDGSIKVPRVL